MLWVMGIKVGVLADAAYCKLHLPSKGVVDDSFTLRYTLVNPGNAKSPFCY